MSKFIVNFAKFFSLQGVCNKGGYGIRNASDIERILKYNITNSILIWI